MNEQQFFWVCVSLFLSSSLLLFCYVLFVPEQSFVVEPYTTKLHCATGSCTFRATISEITDRNETVFYKLAKEVAVDSVFFVGTKKPTFAVGDCVLVLGSVQTYKGKESIVAQTLRACGVSSTN